MAGQKKVEVYESADGKFRFRVKAANGRVAGASEQGFTRRSDAKRRARNDYPGIPIVDR